MSNKNPLVEIKITGPVKNINNAMHRIEDYIMLMQEEETRKKELKDQGITVTIEKIVNVAGS